MSLDRFRTVATTELRFHSVRPLVWVLVVLLALTSFGLSSGQMTIQSGDSTVGGESKAWLTSEFSVAMLFPLVAFLFYVFFVAVAAGMAIPRDDELQVGPLLHATRLTPAEYVWGKFVAVLAVFLAVLVVHLIFQVLFNHLWPNPDAERIRGPFSLVSYLRPAVILAVPCLVFFCGISFAIGERTRTPILVFAAPTAAFLVSIFFLFDWSPSWLDPRINRLLMWIEPSGFRWLNETWLKVDRGIEFYNTQPVGYDVPFLLSRLAYLGAGIVLVALSARHLASTIRGEGAPSRRRKSRREAGAIPPETGEPPPASAPGAATPAALADLRMRRSVPAFARTALDVARFEARSLAAQPGLYLFAPIILVQTIFGQFVRVGAFGTPNLLTPGTAAVASMNALTLLLCLLLLFYTVESVLREKNTGLAPIYWATPSRTAAILLGKAIANGIVAAVILLAAMLGAFVVILVQGKVVFDLRPFLLVWGLLLLPTFLVWATFVTTVLAVTGNRYTTYAVGLAAMAFTGWKQLKGEMNWVGNWDLWSVTTWTDFGSVAPNGTALLLNRSFYLAVTLFLIALTVRVFPRREHDSGAILDRLRPASLLRPALRLFPVAVPALVLGGLLRARVGQGFQGEAAEERAKDYWARNVATWADAETPQIAGADLEVDLEPRERRFRVKGWYDLVNAGSEPMRRFPMSIGDHFENVKWTLGGAEFEPENRAKLCVFELAEPLARGDTVRVGFSHEGRYPNGLTKNGGGMPTFILPAGVVLTSFDTGFVPVPFFEEDRGVDDDNRTEPKDWEDDFFEGPTPPALGSGVRFPVRTRITGPADYDYHGVGVRKQDTVENGRRTVVWESDFPVSFFNVVAAKWAVREGDGVSVYHHPDHVYNLDEIVETLAAARRHYSEWFYPYPWRELRLNEFPGIAFYAQGFPTNITFSEGIGFLTRVTKDVNAPFLITAHETAHQWWGNLLMPGEGPGGNILSEGMAHFSTALLFEAVKGERDRMEFCKRIEERYGEDRVVDAEKPLVRTIGNKPSDNTVMYDKGGWVFWMLHRLMGEEASFAGLRDFIRTYAGGGSFPEGPDYPVLQDYVRVMRRHAPDAGAFDEFVAQWFFDVVVPEYRVRDAESEQAEGGRWIVRAAVENRGSGTMPVEVAATHGERFAEKEEARRVAVEGEEGVAEGPSWRDARVSVVLGPGETREITIACDFEPEEIVVDPDVVVLMLKRDRARASL